MRFAVIFPMILVGCSFTADKEEVPELVTRGALCGDPAIQGIVVGTVEGAGACGIENAIEVDAIGGVLLSQPSLMKCETAQALKGWVNRDMKPAIGDTGGGIQSIKVAAHYACRTRNHRPGARLSEHAKGNAIDISEFRLVDGSSISVLRDWGNGNRGRILKQLHSSACGPFGTVLGPNSDVHHQDHFHFDIAKHRGGAFCR